MKAYTISHYSKKDVLQLVDVPTPVVKDNDVLVEIRAASVNQLDSMIKKGEFKLILPYKLPLILGNDVAGVVVAVGSKVQKFKVGDEVYARPDKARIGTFAEFIAMDEKDVALKPKNLSMVEAASIPLVGLTSWQALIEITHLQEGQKVFIQAGSGGVGTFAIQLAKHIGATVATTTSQKNYDLAKSLGADIIVDYKKEDFAEKLHDYDVVLNSQDAKTLEKSLRILKRGGKLISISGPPDPNFAKEISAPTFIKGVMTALSLKTRRRAKKLGVDYSFLFMRANGDQLSKITALIESGKIKPVVDQVFPFEQTNEALDYVTSGRAKGKVVIAVKRS